MTWVAATMGASRYLLFVYDDPQAGPSGKGVEVTGVTATSEEARIAATQPATTVRLSGVQTSPLPPEWITYLGLPAEPSWMQHFRAPSEAATPWRTDPSLQGKPKARSSARDTSPSRQRLSHSES